MTTDAWVLTYRARGFTDDVTECEHCGRVDLKGTVRMVAVDPDGNEDGETYMGVVCAARQTGRKASEIRTEAARADRERDKAARAAWNAWRDEHTTWICATRDAALAKQGLADGSREHYLAIRVYFQTDEFKVQEAAWKAEHPAPANPWDR